MPQLQNAWLYCKLVYSIISFVSSAIARLTRAVLHKYTYRSSKDPRNVVVIGASFAGWYLARQLCRSLPTGYRVTLIERNSHFHYTWLFPRITVLPAHEDKAFIPYANLPSLAPEGILNFKSGNVVKVDSNTVILANGEVVKFAYLAIATGSSPRYPVELSNGGTKADGVQFFRSRQAAVHGSNDIVIIGGGAVGVEIALDIKSLHPEKNVSLVHSRERLLSHFKCNLSDAALTAMNDHGVNVYFNRRVMPDELLSEGPIKEIRLSSDQVIPCDLLLTCTGQKPASSIISSTFPLTVSRTGTILVKDTLQLEEDRHSNIFALGDVAETQAAKMGRAAFNQAMIVADNIVGLIKGTRLKRYHPGFIEASTELTLGLKKSLLYIDLGPDGLLFSRKSDETMHAAQAWKGLDAVPFFDAAHNGNGTESAKAE